MNKKELERHLVASVLESKSSYSKELKDLHTKMIISASHGDPKAKQYIKEFLRLELIRLDKNYKDKQLANPIIDEIFANNWGLGPLEKYDTKENDEIMIDGKKLSISRGGVIIPLDEELIDESEAIKIIRRVFAFDNSIDLSPKNPKKEGIRKDGARITAELPPLAKVPGLNIRIHESFTPTTENLIQKGTISPDLPALANILIKGRANIIVIGEMGAGKTAFIRWLLGFVQPRERVGLLETSFEVNPEKLYPDITFIQLQENLEGENQKLTDLFKFMLRKNIKRIMLGEVRTGEELHQYKYACNRGHSGAIMSGHYMDAESFLTDGADMLIEAKLGNDKASAKDGLAGTVDIVFRLVSLPSGQRVLASLEEIVHDNGKYEIIPISKYIYDENNPSKGGYHKQLNPISIKLQNKLHSYGLPRNKIDSIINSANLS